MCEMCKRRAQGGIPRHYEEPLHDMHTKCNTYLARTKWYAGEKPSGVRWQLVDDDRYPHLKTHWTKDEDRRRFRVFVRKDIGHKDIPYFIWTHGLPGCLQPEITTAADLNGYTKDLVHWLWNLAEYIVVTKQEIRHTPQHIQRMQRQADNCPMMRRLNRCW